MVVNAHPLLPVQDSNLDSQFQRLSCCHYTNREWVLLEPSESLHAQDAPVLVPHLPMREQDVLAAGDRGSGDPGDDEEDSLLRFGKVSDLLAVGDLVDGDPVNSRECFN